MMGGTSPLLGSLLLMTAGVYQLTPVKQACLRHCRTPLQFLLTCWQDGTAGAFLMALCHGAYCLGCCWLLMAILFAVGVMNLVWIAALSVLVLVEKIIPRGFSVANPNKSQNRIVTRIENVIELRASLPIVCIAKSRGFEVIFPSSAIFREMGQIFGTLQRQSSCALSSLLASNTFLSVGFEN
jgi:Predicted metal-binding integral membrane protein (DUF2182)